ncbi:MAG: epoxyqueuosine reductase QueH [Candidatus Omnitrophota bacterium]
MKLLLHTCCAPCLLAPLRELRKNGFTVSGFFYNPNIHPSTEYQNRRKSVEVLSSQREVEVIFGDYDLISYFRKINNHEDPQERCPLCWRLRLEETARLAKEKGFEYFSTTLLVSPYQDLQVIKTLGEEIGKSLGVKFYYADWRQLFRQAHDEAKQMGLYCQKYCGCIFSEWERQVKIPNPKHPALPAGRQSPNLQSPKPTV